MKSILSFITGLLALFFRPQKVEPGPVPVEPKPLRRLAWGSKVSQAFRDRLFEICQILGVEPDYLMACMAFESAETFSPSTMD